MTPDQMNEKALRASLKRVGLSPENEKKFMEKASKEGLDKAFGVVQGVMDVITPGNWEEYRKTRDVKELGKSIAGDLLMDAATGMALPAAGVIAKKASKAMKAALKKGGDKLKDAATRRQQVRAARQADDEARAATDRSIDEALMSGPRGSAQSTTRTARQQAAMSMRPETKAIQDAEEEVRLAMEYYGNVARRGTQAQKDAAMRDYREAKARLDRLLDRPEPEPAKVLDFAKAAQKRKAAKPKDDRPTEVLEPMNIREELETAAKKPREKRGDGTKIKVPPEVIRKMKRREQLTKRQRPMDEEDYMDIVAQQKRGMDRLREQLKRPDLTEDQRRLATNRLEAMEDTLEELKAFLKTLTSGKDKN